jgi:hypothetical protein
VSQFYRGFASIGRRTLSAHRAAWPHEEEAIDIFKKFFLNVALVCGLFSVASPQSKSGPPVPYIDKGACPFECCTYRQWNVVKATALRTSMSDSAPIGLRLKTGEKVLGVTGVVITTQPGIARAVKNGMVGTMRIRKGEQIYVLTNLGEGFAKVWFKGRVVQGEPYDEATFKFVRQPKSIWWVKIKDRRGRIGWSRQPENFDNIDQCG